MCSPALLLATTEGLLLGGAAMPALQQQHKQWQGQQSKKSSGSSGSFVSARHITIGSQLVAIWMQVTSAS
jgi:hypothetical protein